MRWLALLLLLLPLSALAGTGPVLELGRIDLPVPDRTAGERRAALSEGLDQVLVRLTGYSNLTQLPGLDSVRSGDSARWVVQYRYEETEEDTGDEDSEEPSLVLKARFDVSGLLERLGELDAPVWDEHRPAVLVWLVVQDPTSGELVARDSRGAARTVLEEAARRRGLPLLLPRMDGTDRSAIAAADIRGRFDEPVRTASQRYDTPLVATAVLYTGDAPRLRWRLLDDDREEIAGNFIADSLEAALNTWVDRLTGHLVDLYAVRGSEERAVRIRVKQLERLQDWNTLHSYLRGLAGMRSVELRHLDGATATFAARFAGPVAKLERLAKLQRGLGSCGDEGTLVAASARSTTETTPAPAEPAATEGAEKQQAPAFASLEFCWRGLDRDGDDG